MSSKSAISSQNAEMKRLRDRVRELESKESELEYTQAILTESAQIAKLTSEISNALIQSDPIQDSLQQCTQALVTHLGAAFARIWTFNTETQVLELIASAGLYTHLNGPHSRIPLGAFKIGRIAAQRQPHLTNAVLGDPQVNDQAWAKREGMVAFAGYPLLLDGEVKGVIALFSRQTLSPAVIEAMASVSRSIVLGMERKKIEEERLRFLQLAQQAAEQAEAEKARLTLILDTLPDGFIIFDEQWRYSYINPQAAPSVGKPSQELIGKNVWEEFPELIGSEYDQWYHRAVDQHKPVAFEIFNKRFRGWFDIHAYPIPGGLAIYFRDISERKQAEAERTDLLETTEIARAQAEAAVKVRNDFFSSVSHDLKTPLAVMQGNVQLLQRRLAREAPEDRPWSVERLAVIETSIKKMNGMIEDLLNVAKLQTGQEFDLQMRSLSLLTLIQRICAEQQETTKRHRLIVELPPKDQLVQADLLRLDRALTNVLTNAIKYSPEGGRIILNITYEQEGDQAWAILRVQDEGLGIPHAELPFIFDPFYRASNVKERILGTGVGLASVAQVMKELGGSISVSSEEEQGSCFVLKFPTLSG